MPRLRQVPRAEASPSAVAMYDFLFGRDRDPVARARNRDRDARATGGRCSRSVPDVLDHAVAGLPRTADRSDGLDPKLRELGQ